MEIVTYIVEGSLTHQDSIGTSETLGRGAVQFMTSGSGVRHSEHNLDKSNPLRFIQIWLNPNRSGLKPNYGWGLANIYMHATSSTAFLTLVCWVECRRMTWQELFAWS